jgi:hypothetical protein
MPGYGKQGGSQACTPCAFGSYQAGGQSVCSACPSTAFYSPVDGAGATYTATGTTFYLGSRGEEMCVPRASQLSPEAGQAYFAAGASASRLFTPTNNVASLDACIALCPAGKGCMAQYDVAGRVCQLAALDLAAADATGRQLAYKLPPSTVGSASKVKEGASAKMMASGFYAYTDLSAVASATWSTLGTNLGPDARTFATGAAAWDTNSRDGCKRKCDNSNNCALFIYDAASASCLYKGGVDALATRSFFAIPDPAATSLAALKW